MNSANVITRQTLLMVEIQERYKCYMSCSAQGINGFAAWCNDIKKTASLGEAVYILSK